METAKRVAKNTGFLYARMGITVFISLYATRLVLSALGTEDYGIFNVVGGVIAMLGFLNASMTAATQRFISFAHGTGVQGKVQQLFNVSVLLHILIAVLVFIILELAGYFFFNGILNIPPNRLQLAKIIYQFMILSTLFSILSVPYDAVVNARENMLFFAVLGIIESLIKLVIALLITQITDGQLLVFGISMASLSLFLFLLRIAYCRHKYKECRIKISMFSNKPLMREMAAFAGWSLLGSSTSMIANYGQILIVNFFFGAVVNAAQGVAVQVGGQLGVFASTMMKALNPVIDKSEGAGNRSNMLKTSMAGSKIGFILLAAMCIPFLIEIKYIMGVWLKVVPMFTVIFCQLQLIRCLIEQLFQPLYASIAAVGSIKRFQIVSSIITIFPLCITYLFFATGYPPYTMFIVFIAYALVNSAMVIYFAHKICGLSIKNFLSKVVSRSLISFFVVLIVCTLPHLILDDGFLRFLSVALTSVVCWPLVLWLITFTPAEKVDYKNLFKSLMPHTVSPRKVLKLIPSLPRSKTIT